MTTEVLGFASASDGADAGAFLARVVRLDPSALVRLRGAGDRVALWAWLPLEVLVTRVVRGDAPADTTVPARALLDAITGGGLPGGSGTGAEAEEAAGGAEAAEAAVGAAAEAGVGAAAEAAVGAGVGGGRVVLPGRRDADWPGALPPQSGVRELDEIPAGVVGKLLAAAEQTFREASASADPRAVGDALLDHEVLTVSAGDTSAAVPLRLLLALARMGFLGDDSLRVGLAGGWVRAAASYGVAYRRRSALSLSPR